MKEAPKAQVRLMRLAEVKQVTGLSRASIYRFADDGAFPRPVKIGDRAIAWRSTDIEAWIDGLASA